MQSQELRPGDVVAGKYRVRSVLSQNRGTLVEAFHTEFDQRVVIRVISPHDADEKEVERFRRESRVLAKLESEHAARIIDVGTQADGSFYLVRQFLDGIDLARRIQSQGPLPIWDAVLFILQAAEAVAETHAHGIILRELGTSHLFLTERLGGQTTVKLIDFGTAKLLRDDSSGPAFEGGEVTTTTMFGLSPYSSPEVVRKDKRVDQRTDVWSLGAILYEMVTGRPPFNGDMALLMLQITKEQPPPVQSLRPDAPPNLVNAIMRAMTKVVESRYQDVYALAKALSPFSPAEGKVLIERIGRLTKAGAHAAAHASAADDEEMEISQVEEISSLHSVSASASDDEDDDDAPTRVGFTVEDAGTEVTAARGRGSVGAGPRRPESTHRRESTHRQAAPLPAKRSLKQEKTIPVGRSFVPVSPAPPPAPPPPKAGPVFAGAAAGPPPDDKTMHYRMDAAPSSSPQPVSGRLPAHSSPGNLLGPPLGLEPPRGSWPGLPPDSSPSPPSGPLSQPAPHSQPHSQPGPLSHSPASVPSPHTVDSPGAVAPGRKAVVAVIAAACVLLPGLLGILFFRSEQAKEDEQKLAQRDAPAAVSEAKGEEAPSPLASASPAVGDASEAPPEEPDAPPPPDDAPPLHAGVSVPPGLEPGPAPVATGRPTGTWAPPPPPPAKTATPSPPASDPPKASGSDKGTLVAIAVGGTCAFAVNGASKGTTTTLKLAVDPGTYSVSCKPATGHTKSKSVQVKSGATAMAMFKL